MIIIIKVRAERKDSREKQRDIPFSRDCIRVKRFQTTLLRTFEENDSGGSIFFEPFPTVFQSHRSERETRQHRCNRKR